MGSGSLTESGSSSTESSLNGLKFGQKIYFEDVGNGAPPKPKKVRGSSVQVGQSPKCQVEGCNVDLSDAKVYYSRHKVCGTHSKSPNVIVAGSEQRFCQQCSRFHQLSEFDQGKRSCRKRLAGHNERRRKPQPGSLLSTRYGRLSLPIFENGSRFGSFLMDFGAHPKPAGRDTSSTPRSAEQVCGNQNYQTTPGMGKNFPHPWQFDFASGSSDLLLQSSASGTYFSGPIIPSGEGNTGVTDSTFALSLLSNQPWGSRNRTTGISVNTLIDTEGGAPLTQTTAHVAVSSHFPAASWVFKGNEGATGMHEMTSDVGLSQISQPLSSAFSSDDHLPQHDRRQYELFSGAFDFSTEQMHWSG